MLYFYQFLVRVFIKPLIKALHEELDLLSKTVGAENTDRITKRIDAVEKQKVEMILNNALNEDICKIRARMERTESEMKILYQEKKRILDDLNMLRARLNLYERRRHLGEATDTKAEDVTFEGSNQISESNQ